MIGPWRTLRNEELHNLYFSPNIIRTFKLKNMRRERHITHIGEKTNACRILPGKPGGKRPLGRHRYRSEYNIKMELRNIGWGGMGWILLVQDVDQWLACIRVLYTKCMK
jgi:hypothetical protein